MEGAVSEAVGVAAVAETVDYGDDGSSGALDNLGHDLDGLLATLAASIACRAMSNSSGYEAAIRAASWSITSDTSDFPY